MITTFNRADCHCGRDHDSLEHLMMKLVGLHFQRQLQPDEIPDLLGKLAAQVGWENVNPEAKSLETIASEVVLKAMGNYVESTDLATEVQTTAYLNGWTHKVVHPRP